MTLNSINALFTPHIPVSWGELFDKISILEIKKENVLNELAMKNITQELELLDKFVSNDILKNRGLMDLRVELKNINQNIWNIEDEIRIKESTHDFEDRFIELARNTYIFNDKRASVKRIINKILNSPIVEEKIY
tara:strand:- start:140 stop:544 length:405 start_codon:yes stop_codon:yes gene_type:complete